MSITPDTHPSPTSATPTGDTPAPGEVRDLFARAARVTTELIGSVRPDQLTLPTPCGDMDVRELLGHLMHVLDRLTALGKGESPFGFADRVAASDDTWLDTWLEAAHETQAAWSDPAVLDQPMWLPWAEGPGREMMQGYISELVTHTWDLAMAVGAHPTWDDDVLDAAWEMATAWLPADNRTELFEEVLSRIPDAPAGPYPYADAVPVADDAPLIDRLIAHQGRDPHWRA